MYFHKKALLSTKTNKQESTANAWFQNPCKKNEQYLPNLSQILFAACPSLKSSFMWKCQDGLAPKWHFSPWHSEKDEKEPYRPWDHSSQSRQASHANHHGLKRKRTSSVQPAHTAPRRRRFLWLPVLGAIGVLHRFILFFTILKISF